MTDQPAAYRDLLARLDRERAQAAHTAAHAPAGEVGLVAQGIATGLKIATAHAITAFEGQAAGEQWLAAQQPPPPAHNAGPSVREAAAQDNAHWNDKYAGEGQ